MNRRRFLRYLIALSSPMVLPLRDAAASTARHTATIPSSGERLPVIGMGSWLTLAVDPQDAQEMDQREQVVREFLELGGGMLDSSPMYGTAQEVIGHCLQRIGHHKGLFAATKVWVRGNRAGVLQMEQSRLLWGVSRFDLMQVHNLLDWEKHLPVLHEMKQQGQVRYVGVTTSHGRRHEELMHIMQTRKIDFVQLTYNLLDREAEQTLLPMAADRGIAVIINRPFQRGGLFDHVAGRALPNWAQEIDCKNWAQFFLKFIVSHPGVTCAIPATSRVDHLRENMGAAYGRMPDARMRSRMAHYVENI